MNFVFSGIEKFYTVNHTL